MVWCHAATYGDTIPAGRGGHTCTAIGTNIIMFGGATPEGPFSDVHVLDTESYAWSKPACSGNAPSHRYEHAAVAVEDNVWIFGGAGTGEPFNDVYILNSKTWEWTKPQLTGIPPCRRTLHFVANIAGMIYIYGGSTGGSSVVNETTVYVLDTHTLTWSEKEVLNASSAPSPRMGHVMFGNGSTVYVHGGMADIVFFDDIHALDTDTMAWSGALTTTGAIPCCRSAHAVATIGNKLYLFGGMTVDPNDGPMVLDDCYELDLGTMMWKKFESDIAGPPARLDHTLTKISVNRMVTEEKEETVEEVMVFGGMDMSGIFYNDCYSLNPNESASKPLQVLDVTQQFGS